jgi:hypothetical protein
MTLDIETARRSATRTKIAIAIGLAIAVGVADANSPRTTRSAAPFSSAERAAPWFAKTRAALRAKARVHVAPAGAIPVTNCDDSGSGSLRDVIANVAGDGATIDLTQLTCSTISLTTGALVIEQYDLVLQGPGMSLLTLSGADAHRVIEHDRGGHLTIRDLGIADGLNENVYYAYGGCVYSAGYLTLDGVEVRDCVNRSTAADTINPPLAEGGGVFSRFDLTVTDSSLVYNTVADSGHIEFSITYGGALAAHSTISIAGSYIGHNVSTRTAGGFAAPDVGLTMSDSIVAANSALYVGGVTTFGRVTIDSSAIVDNTAARFGGLVVGGNGKDESALVRNTTISGNTGDRASGVLLGIGDVLFDHCTIAFNASTGSEGGVGFLTNTYPFELESTIVADNSTLDSSGATLFSDLDGGGTVGGTHNLIGVSPLTLPADTIRDDPHLLPLADNGGATLTHALAFDSPAIDRGDNIGDVPFDQRGAGFPRVVGLAADIGAFEFNDTIFADGFGD